MGQRLRKLLHLAQKLSKWNELFEINALNFFKRCAKISDHLKNFTIFVFGC